MTNSDPLARLLHSNDARLVAATEYVLSNPGKQIRSKLTRAAYSAVQADVSGSTGLMTVSTAIEWLHSYSLVHDDLPAMDNDDLRRGKPTVHKAFDEATAILVGDGLQAAAFGAIASETTLSADQRVRLIALIADAVGFGGMVGGQAMDMTAENQQVSLEALQQIHRQKTGALIRAAVLAGAVCGQADEDSYARLQRFAEGIGLAFQIIDDVLDVTQSSSELGKTAGKDEAVNKSTYVSCLGLDAARTHAEDLLDQALNEIAPFHEQGAQLANLATQIVRRLN